MPFFHSFYEREYLSVKKTKHLFHPYFLYDRKQILKSTSKPLYNLKKIENVNYNLL